MKRMPKICVALLVSASAVLSVACSGGPAGDGIPSIHGHDKPGSPREPPPAFRQDPGSRTGDTSACLACGNFRCVGTAEGVPIDVVVALAPSTSSLSGSCTLNHDEYTCSGDVVRNGKLLGHWTRTGPTTYHYVAKDVDVTCTTTTDQPEPQPVPRQN